MEPFVTLSAIAAPMPTDNINTDDIFPGPSAGPLGRLGRYPDLLADLSDMGINAFAAQRWRDDGTARPEFVLNRAPYDQAKILITGKNFGCGSSREMAVWCLTGIGIRCVIAASFGDIFAGNCFKNGLLPVRLPQGEVNELLDWAARDPTPRLQIDLPNQTVQRPGTTAWGFEVGEYQKRMLLEGLDEVGATLRRRNTIEEHERTYYIARPWLVEGSKAR
jgi:3-isopropylmalate/(R)-2-methylmalate dehydratase small subunit